MNYYRKLASQLRTRGQSEEKVEDVLREVEEFVITSGSAPEVEFGSPAELASQYPKLRRKKAGWYIYSGTFTIMIVIYLTERVTYYSGNPIISIWATILVLIALAVAGSVVAAKVNHRLPKSLARLDRKTS